MPPASDDLTPGGPGEGSGGPEERPTGGLRPRKNGSGNGDGAAHWADSRTPGQGEQESRPFDPPHTIFGRPPPARRRPIPSTLIWIAVAVLAAILIGWGASKLIPAKTGRGGPGGFGGGRGQVTVSTAKAALGDMPIQFEALGTVTPLATITVHTRIAGVLDRVDFHEGQMIKANQRLALVDPRPYQIALKQAQGQLLKDQAQLENAQLDLKRYQTLVSQDSISRQTADTQAALVKQDQGIVLTDEAAVANAKLNLAYCTITSPVAGRVGLRHVDPGNFVQTGDANGIVTVTQLSPIDVVFTLPEDDVPTVTRRLGQGAVLPVSVLDRSSVNTLGQGALAALDNTIDPTTGTVKVKARFTNVDGALFPSQFVNVKVLVDNLQNVVLAPTAAIRHGAPGDFVFVLTGRTAHMRPVKLGPTNGETTAILSGLNAGETVITAGGDRLKDGASVMLPGDTPRFGGAGGRGGKGGHHRGQGGQGGQSQGGYGGQGGDGSQAQGQSVQAGSAPPPQAGQAPPSGAQQGQHGQWQGKGKGNWQGRHRPGQNGGQNGGNRGGGAGGL